MRGGDIQQREVTEAEQPAETDEGETASYNTFYTKLDPYGAWRETSDYGYVFQPNEAERSRNWRPYANGRWVYTDAGWTWYSEEPFGWATYHYGRWTRLRNIGWVWVPGDEWAPAWVSWRKSDDYVGWAPLPPEARFDRSRGIHNWADNYYDVGPDQYAFVPTNDFGDQRIERTIVPVERNVTIVNQTTNVTNITYNNTTIVNQGPNYEELRQRTRQPIERLRLERRARFENQNPQTVVRGESIEMSAPAIAPAQQTGRPRAVKEKIAQTVVDRGWNEIRDKKAAEKARAKMKAEATPPAGAPPVRVTQAQTQQTPEPAQPAETPVRNFPDRAKMKAHPSATVPPGIRTTPSPSASPRARRQRQADRQMKEAQRAQKEKARVDEKAAQQTKDGRTAQSESCEKSTTIADARGFCFSTRDTGGKTVAESNRCETFACNFRSAAADARCETAACANAARLREEACIAGAEFESLESSVERHEERRQRKREEQTESRKSQPVADCFGAVSRPNG